MAKPHVKILLVIPKNLSKGQILHTVRKMPVIDHFKSRFIEIHTQVTKNNKFQIVEVLLY